MSAPLPDTFFAGLELAERHGADELRRLPCSLRILAENLLRHEDDETVRTGSTSSEQTRTPRKFRFTSYGTGGSSRATTAASAWTATSRSRGCGTAHRRAVMLCAAIHVGASLRAAGCARLRPVTSWVR